MTLGYAINALNAGGILLDTVSPTRRGAIVAWLQRQGASTLHIYPDVTIDAMWRSLRNEHTYCILVEVSASQEPGADVTEKPYA